MSKFKTGDVIKCIDNSNNSENLTVGKHYTVVDSVKKDSDYFVRVFADDGRDATLFSECRFISVDEAAERDQVGGNHYGKNDPIKFANDNFSAEQVEGFYRINALKYIARYDKKNGVEDLRKARHYIDMLIEMKV